MTLNSCSQSTRQCCLQQTACTCGVLFKLMYSKIIQFLQGFFFNIRHWYMQLRHISVLCTAHHLQRHSQKMSISNHSGEKSLNQHQSDCFFHVCYNDPPALVYTCLKSLFASHKYRERGLPVFLMRGRTSLYCTPADLGCLAIRGGSWASHQDMASKYAQKRDYQDYTVVVLVSARSCVLRVR